MSNCTPARRSGSIAWSCCATCLMCSTRSGMPRWDNLGVKRRAGKQNAVPMPHGCCRMHSRGIEHSRACQHACFTARMSPNLPRLTGFNTSSAPHITFQVIDPVRRASVHCSAYASLRTVLLRPALGPTGVRYFSPLNAHADAGTSTGTVDLECAGKTASFSSQ